MLISDNASAQSATPFGRSAAERERWPMRLTIEPKPSLPQFSSDLDLVIVTTDDDRIPEIFVTEGSPVPDRHMLLGLVQIVSVAVQEQDPESVCPYGHLFDEVTASR